MRRLVLGEVPDVVAEWTGRQRRTSLLHVRGAARKRRAVGILAAVRRGDAGCATLELLTEEDLKELGLPLGCRRRLLAALTSCCVIMRPSPALLAW